MNGAGRCQGAVLRLLLLAGALVTLTGCVTAKKYRLARENTPPAKVLGWSTSAPPVELTLQSLVVFHGAGSWKSDARWDEYVVRVVNHGAKPVTIESAALIDL